MYIPKVMHIKLIIILILSGIFTEIASFRKLLNIFILLSNNNIYILNCQYLNINIIKEVILEKLIAYII